MKTANTVVTIVTALLLSGAAGVANDEEPDVYGAVEYRGEGPVTAGPAAEEYGDDHESGEYGRIRYLDNGVTLIRGFSSDFSPAEDEGTVNSPIYPEDSVRTGGGERVEIQLAHGSVVHIDEGSDLTFQALPNPYAEFQDNTVIGLHEGAIRVHALVGEDEVFRIDTPAASIYLLNDTDVRVEIGSDGRTVVSTYRGVAELAADGGSVLVRGGMTATAHSGTYPEEPRSFNTMSGDRFDRWVEDREATYLASDRHVDEQHREEIYADLPSEVRPYYRELSDQGRWVYVNDYGWCWYPEAVESDWRPYRAGYWHYGPSGYFWVSNEPWGWAPYHYGRWDWVGGIGWCWIPGRVFSGAWVSWSWGPAYVGWAPLGYYNRVAVVGDVYYEHYASRSWTFVSYTHIVHRHGYRRYAVPVHRIGTGHGHRIVTRPPRVSPRDLARDRDARRRAQDEVNHRRRVQRDRGRGPRFTDNEDRAVRNRSVKRTRRVAEGPPAGRRREPGDRRNDRGSRQGNGRDGGGARTQPGGGDRATAPPARRVPTAGPRVLSRERPDNSDTRTVGSRGRPKQIGPRDDANRRVRDLYDRAARPPSARRNQDTNGAGRREPRPRVEKPGTERRPTRPTAGTAPRDRRTPTRTAPPSSRRTTGSRRSTPSTPPSSRRTTGSRRSTPSTPPSSRRTTGSRRSTPSTPPSSRRTTGSRRSTPATPPRARSGGGSRTSPGSSASPPARRNAPKSSASSSSSRGRSSGSRSSGSRSSGSKGTRGKSSDSKSGRSGKRR